jgi:hypothetical protein
MPSVQVVARRVVFARKTTGSARFAHAASQQLLLDQNARNGYGLRFAI